MAMQNHRPELRSRRNSVLDILHVSAILACAALTSKVVIDERFGGADSAAVQFLSAVRLSDRSFSLTIRLDDNARTAAR